MELAIFIGLGGLMMSTAVLVVYFGGKALHSWVNYN